MLEGGDPPRPPGPQDSADPDVSRQGREQALRRLAQSVPGTMADEPTVSTPARRPAERPADAAARFAPSAAASVWRLSLSASVAAQQRRARLVALVSGALLVAVVVGALALHDAAGLPLPGLFGSASLLPGEINRVYLDVDVPWATVTLDGRTITPPIIGKHAPLTLAPGTHHIRWTAEPFDPQSCIISIPASRDDTCQFTTTQVVTLPHQPTAQLVYLGESLATLSTPQQTALKQVIQVAMQGYTTQAQPGEPYISLRTIANEPLRVTLGEPLYTDASGSPPEECFYPLNTYYGGCILNGRNCVQICTLPWSSRVQLPAPDSRAWYAFALSELTWSVRTLSGQSLISDQPLRQIPPSQPPIAPDPVLLRITWSSAGWSAWQVVGPALPRQLVLNDDGAPIPSDPACFDAYDMIQGAADPYAHYDQLGSYTQVRFISGPNPAMGCLVEATVGAPGKPPAKGAPVAKYLDRLGLVYALNSVEAPDLMPPGLTNQPSATQQQLAQSLSEYPGEQYVLPATVDAGQ